MNRLPVDLPKQLIFQISFRSSQGADELEKPVAEHLDENVMVLGVQIIQMTTVILEISRV